MNAFLPVTLRRLLVGLLLLGGLATARAVLPEAPKPSPKPKTAVAGPASSASGAERAAEVAEAKAQVKRGSMESCLSEQSEVRRLAAEQCVLAKNSCYDKAGCEVQPDGRYRCTRVNAEFTARYTLAMAAPCR